MSRLTLKLKAAPDCRIDLSGLLPALAPRPSLFKLAKLAVGGGIHTVYLGDVFTIAGEAGDDIVIEGGSDRLDGVGAGLSTGNVTLVGDAGANAGRHMTGGRFDIKGNAGAYLATGMKAGTIHVTGSAGDFTGAVGTGKRFGMTGGTVIVEGSIGARAGDKMRRGQILVRGKTGPAAGSRMVGGTIVAEGGFGPQAGELMRRGTLIGPSADHMLATFGDCGLHDLVILKVMARAWARELGTLAPRPLPPVVRRFAGDLAAIGKGELLITAA